MAEYDFEGRTVLVTGGANGIGAATARRLAAEGATVIIADVDSEGGEAVSKVITEEGGTAEFAELDVTDEGAFEELVGRVADRHGGLDVLVNNAGTVHIAPLVETDVEDRDRLIDVNVNGVWNGCRAAFRKMVARGDGCVVNVSSTGGLLGSPGLATYSATKAAVVNFTRAMAGEVGRDGVRVNAVCPGTVDTEMAAGVMAREDDPEAARERAAAGHALGRIGDPEEIAAAITFLASDEASFITGHALAVDGGQSAVLRY
jgi:NAD(P)-dependent dehydrogenase (short-subunit alcohol dehydrogenase family)